MSYVHQYPSSFEVGDAVKLFAEAKDSYVVAKKGDGQGENFPITLVEKKAYDLSVEGVYDALDLKDFTVFISRPQEYLYARNISKPVAVGSLSLETNFFYKDAQWWVAYTSEQSVLAVNSDDEALTVWLDAAQNVKLSSK